MMEHSNPNPKVIEKLTSCLFFDVNLLIINMAAAYNAVDM